MILSHEMPLGSKFYFGKSATLKRRIESRAANILQEAGFCEICTPSFSFLQHQRDSQSREVVRISNELNHQIILRHDSTIDAIRLLAPHLSAQKEFLKAQEQKDLAQKEADSIKTNLAQNSSKTDSIKFTDLSTNKEPPKPESREILGKKWFYIQPVFSFPTNELNQIGAEILDANALGAAMLGLLRVGAEIFSAFNLAPFWQIYNVRIPRICSEIFELSLETFEKVDLDKICSAGAALRDLSRVESASSLRQFCEKWSAEVRISELIAELAPLLEFAQKAEQIAQNFTDQIIAATPPKERPNYTPRVICSPLFYPKASYYDGLGFAAFLGNSTLLSGGQYEMDSQKACGFGIYTDALLALVLQKQNA